MVVLRFSNSTACMGMSRIGFSVARLTELSGGVLAGRKGTELALHTDVDGRLVLSGLAGLVLGGERGPVQRTEGVFVAEMGDLDFAFCTFVEAVEAGRGCRAGNEK
jgi:hypothetical protein